MIHLIEKTGAIYSDRREGGISMNVAIMGAGLSGLCCAITLERLGVNPTIYEKRRIVGDRFINGEAFMSLLTRPIIDPIRYFMEEHQIEIKPVSHIRTMQIFSENEQATINGNLGFLNIRGRHPLALENQLANQVKSPIHFHSEYTYEELLETHSHVVLATGDASYAEKLQPFKVDTTASLIGATIEGNFDRYTVFIWLNNRFAPKGYGYLLPFSETEANLVLGYPDNLVQANKEELWNEFYNEVCMTLNQSLKVTDSFNISNYIMGTCSFPRIGNTFFVGNCFGSLMPFLGFGQLEAMLTGIYAAYDICGLGKYEDLVKPIQNSYNDSATLRHAIEKLETPMHDIIVKQLDGYLGKALFQKTRINPLKVMGFLLRPFVRG